MCTSVITGLSKKVLARLCELAPNIVVSSRNLGDPFLDNPVFFCSHKLIRFRAYVVIMELIWAKEICQLRKYFLIHNKTQSKLKNPVQCACAPTFISLSPQFAALWRPSLTRTVQGIFSVMSEKSSKLVFDSIHVIKILLIILDPNKSLYCIHSLLFNFLRHNQSSNRQCNECGRSHYHFPFPPIRRSTETSFNPDRSRNLFRNQQKVQ